MTRFEYESIAAAIHRTGMASRIGKRQDSAQTLRLVALDIAATLAHHHSNGAAVSAGFDKEEFLRHCGVTP